MGNANTILIDTRYPYMNSNCIVFGNRVFILWEVAMEITRLRQIMNRYWWIIAAGAIIIASAVLVFHLSTPPKYQAEMSLLIVPRTESSFGSPNSPSTTSTVDRATVAQTLGEMARSRKVLERASSSVDANLLKLFDEGKLQRDITVLPATYAIRIQVTGPNATTVAVATDALGRASQAVASELPYPYSLQVLDSVQVPTQPIESHLATDTLLGLIVGAFAGFGIALAVDYLHQPNEEYLPNDGRRHLRFREREPLS
jgi:capsular polysaccharide biosynthesis protein